MATQSTLGEWKAEAIALLQALPTELPEGFKENRAWYHARIRELLRVNSHSETARQLEAVLAGTQVQHIETRNPFPSTRIEPAFFIPKGYKSSSGTELAQRLQTARPGISLQHLDQLIASCKLAEGADGVYAIPKVSFEANRLGLTMEQARGNFGQLIEEACKALSSQRKFHNYREGELGPDRLEVVDKTWDALMKLEEQPGDVCVLSAHTGTPFAGRRPDWSRWEMEHSSSQWPISPYEAGWMLIGNPHRLEGFEHLVIDCPGIKYRFGDDWEFEYILYFSFSGGRLFLSNRWSGYPRSHCGSGSGFFQQ